MFLIVLAVAFAVSLVFHLQRKRHAASLPPGPPRLPLVGNFRQISTLGQPKPWHVFHKWAKEYGPLTYLDFLGKPIVIISTAQAANDLLVRRASNYSNRPCMIVASKYLSGGLNFIVSSGDIWRRMRRASEVQLGVKSLLEYEDIQKDEGVVFAYDMLARPENCKENILRVTASVILSMVYDQAPLKSLDEPSVRMLDDYNRTMSLAAQPGAYLVEVLPMLDHLPDFLSPWRKNAKDAFQECSSMLLGKYRAVDERRLSGEQRPSLCAKLLEAGSRRGDLTDLESAWTAATIYEAAYETTATTLSWFFFVMIQFPHVQRKAQEEIDTVVGRSRFPSFSDMNHLSYIRALIREILRWRPPTPMGVPHESVKDDYYDGQFIPAGSLCISNVWSINRDPEIYGADAEDFRPERHLDSDGKLKDEKDEGHFTFGFGKRECVGRHFANKALFINITMVLWAISIEASGNIIIPDVSEEVGEGVLSHPPPYECTCKPRFAGVDVTLKTGWEAVFAAHGG